MKRWTYLLAALGVAAVVAGLLYWNGDNMKDRRVWNRLRAELADANVSQIEFGAASRPMQLNEADRRELLALYREAKFDRSNRAGEGPTPQAVISITFTDGTKVNVGMWSFSTYELSPRHLDPDTQFLIKSDELGVWLRNRFSGPTVGAGGLPMPPASPFFADARTVGTSARSL
ncbi:MAG: hypothetical protein K0R39_2633 [Symbiobacteriaceae bacterium]|jgi:hypothetical protein|nr:hypothetical protein [Symbiobacteriaceae bacterium]